ncbi:hypothetical protein P7C70_g358, partial [Phenoliferia sp. Uapishka_3]
MSTSIPPAPLDLTYVPPLPALPTWLSATSSPTATTIETYLYPTYVSGIPALATGVATLTKYETAIIQLALTVDVNEGVSLGWPYTTPGGTGPTEASVLGATAVFTIPPEVSLTRKSTFRWSSGVASEAQASTDPFIELPQSDFNGSATVFPPSSSIIPLIQSSSTPSQGIRTSISTLETGTISTMPTTLRGSSLSPAMTSTASFTNSRNPSSTSSPSPSPISPSSTTLASSSRTTSNSTPVIAVSHHARNLTAGQIVGIALGTFFVALFVILILAICCRRCRRREQNGGYSSRGRHAHDGRPNQWSFVPAARPVTMSETGEGREWDSPRRPWINSLLAGTREPGIAREREPLQGSRDDREDDDEEPRTARPGMIERGSARTRLYEALPLSHSPPSTPPVSPTKPTSAPLFRIARKRSPRPSSADLLDWKTSKSNSAAAGTTTPPAGEVEGESDRATSSLTPPRSTDMVQTGKSWEESKLKFTRAEMGWLMGRDPRPVSDSEGGSRTTSRASSTLNTGSSPGSRGKRPPPSPSSGLGNSMQSSTDSPLDESRRSSWTIGTTSDQSPDISTLFFSAPRWGTRNATIEEEPGSPPSPTTTSNTTPQLHPAFIFHPVDRPFLQVKGSPISVSDSEPPGLTPSPRRPPSSQSHTSGTGVKTGLGLGNRISGVLASLGLPTVSGSRPPQKDEERLLGDATDNLTSFSPRRPPRIAAVQPATPEEDDFDEEDDMSRWRKPLATARSFEAPPDSPDSPELQEWPSKRDIRASSTFSTGTLGQVLSPDSPPATLSSLPGHRTSGKLSQHSRHSSESSHRGAFTSENDHDVRHSLNISDVSTTAEIVTSPPPLSPPELAHDPWRNTLGRPPASLKLSESAASLRRVRLEARMAVGAEAEAEAEVGVVAGAEAITARIPAIFEFKIFGPARTTASSFAFPLLALFPAQFLNPV